MTDTIRVDLGRADEFRELPARVTVGSRDFFLVRNASGYRLLSTICPHQGGTVFDDGTRFECPLHQWKFDRSTGRCLNAPSRELTSFPVQVQDGSLYADVAPEAHIDRIRQPLAVSKPSLTVRLYAHACLEISDEGFTLLTDPWLDGPAFLGAWAQYPPPSVRGPELRPDAILITHEHPDHFHEPTLRHFARHTPIYVPDFPNQRLWRHLIRLGFHDVRVMRFGETRDLGDNWTVTAFEPDSYWNDALVLIDVAGFRVFNINDAGINARIARSVGRVDLLAVQFSAGASGYPWTWSHLSDEQKIAISQQMCSGKLNLIREAATLYQAATVLPFASHFTLWHPSHRATAAMMKRNRLSDVARALTGTGAEVVDLLPGDTWDVGKGLIRRERDDDVNLYDPEVIAAYMDRAVDAPTFSAHHPTDESLTESELIAYLLRLNDVPEIVLSEELTVRIRGQASTADRQGVDVTFAIAGGRIDVLASHVERANITMSIPLAVLTTIIREERSWDEAFIGYWCQFDRFPNVYHAGFWRLLQAPYFKKPLPISPPSANTTIDKRSTVAEVLETYGAEADRVLRRYGLYCRGCHHSTAESIELAARQHGIEHQQVDLLVKELNRALVER